MDIIWAMLVGLAVGALAKLIMPGKDPGGIIVTMLLGIGGSLLAYLVGKVFGWYESYASGPGFIASLIGAIAVLAIYRALIGRRPRHT